MNSLMLMLVVAAPFAVEHVRVEVGDGTARDDVTVVMDQGKILSIGAAAPAGATRLDGTGKTLTPGLIDATGSFGLREVDAEEATVDDTLKDAVLVPAFRAIDGFNPLTVRIPIAREEGVTSALLLPQAGLIKGTAYLVSMTGSLEDLPDPKRPVVMVGDFAGGGAAVSGGARGGAWLKLREALADARWYAKNKAAVEQNRSRALTLSPLQLEALLPVLEGKLPLLLWADRAADVLAAVRFGEDEKVHVIIGGAAEAWLVARQLAKAKVPVLLTPSSQVPGDFNAVHARDDAATVLEKAGVEVALSCSDGFHRRLRQEAGIATAYGLPRNVALAAITGRTAKLLGLDDRGLIAPGKRADVILWSGDPLELSTRAEKVFIGGVEQPLATRQTKLVERYLK